MLFRSLFWSPVMIIWLLRVWKVIQHHHTYSLLCEIGTSNIHLKKKWQVGYMWTCLISLKHYYKSQTYGILGNVLCIQLIYLAFFFKKTWICFFLFLLSIQSICVLVCVSLLLCCRFLSKDSVYLEWSVNNPSQSKWLMLIMITMWIGTATNSIPCAFMWYFTNF